MQKKQKQQQKTHCSLRWEILLWGKFTVHLHQAGARVDRDDEGDILYLRVRLQQLGEVTTAGQGTWCQGLAELSGGCTRGLSSRYCPT